MVAKKPYIIAIIIQLIYTGQIIVNKAAFDHGINTYVFMFYRQAAASLLLLPISVVLERRNLRTMSSMLHLKLFICALIGITISLNIYNLGLKMTSASVASASVNSLPALTFCMALLLRMEKLNVRSSSGIAKVTGVALCLAGVFVIAFYAGPSLSPVNHHRAFKSTTNSHTDRHAVWIEGTFFAVLGMATWSLWMVMQAYVLKEFPNKMLVTVIQCVFSTVQSFMAAVIAARDFSEWKLHLDVGLLSVAYSGLVVYGVSYYLQAWCIEMKGPVFFAAWFPVCFVLTIFCSSFFLGEIVHLGSVIGGILLSGGLYGVLWGKSKETSIELINTEPEVEREKGRREDAPAPPVSAREHV
ncbi:hypothetical protein ACP4OV_010210 [Aristida adscensionis]